MRRAEQLHQRAASEVRRDRAEHQVDRRGKRLRRERQRVERLVRHLRVAEHLPRQVQVRQRPLEHDRRPAQRRRAPRVFSARTNSRQLLFAIAADERARHLGARRRVRDDQHRCAATAALEPDVLDAGQQALVQPLMEAGLEERFGRDDIDRLHARHAREQIEVRRPQPAAIRRLVGDGDDEATIERPR